MSKYPFVSGKVVLARLIRSLGYKLPSTYYDDILEWIPEALGMMQVTNSMIVMSTSEENCPGEIQIVNHCASLPCGFITVIAVEDSFGKRLPLGGDQTDYKIQTSMRHIGVGNAGGPRVSSFEVDPYQHQTSTGVPAGDPGTIPPYYISGDDITQSNTSTRSTHYYKIEGNYIQTSFEEGFIRIHYYGIPTCSDGYPLIPDNQNFQQAIEWHLIKRLIGSGYQHPVFSYEKADEQWEKYAARGMGEVSMYTPEGAARLNRTMVRLIPPHHLYEDFFINSEQSERLYK